MTIAIIGWGSLIWDLDDLAPKVSGAWHIGKGPALPLEFSRISPKRLGALAVVIDADHGDPCPTSWIASTRSTLAEAVTDLAARERTTEAFIGCVNAIKGDGRSHSASIKDVVQSWCQDHALDGAVWTDLPSNFTAETGQPFTVDTAAAYLQTLEGLSLTEAVRYITEAPVATDTPLRRALVDNRWWNAQV